MYWIEISHKTWAGQIKAFFKKFSDLASISPKTVFWPYFRSLNQNVSPPLISKLNIRNLYESSAEESVKIRIESFVRISISIFYKSSFDFPKIDKFQLISYKIFLEPSKSAFLTTYGDKKTTPYSQSSIWESIILAGGILEQNPKIYLWSLLMKAYVDNIYFIIQHHLVVQTAFFFISTLEYPRGCKSSDMVNRLLP